MNILFVSQSESLPLFDAMRAELETQAELQQVGYVLADSFAYERWLKDGNESFEKRGYHLLKEWEVTQRRSQKTDLDLLQAYEDKIGAEPGLFGAIVADRRLIMGKHCTYKQDYSRRFTDQELLSILQAGICRVEKLFDELQPDVVVSFICVTMLDYLVHLFAKSRGVRVINIRPTRVSDRISISSTLNDPSPEFIDSFEKCLTQGSKFNKESASYLKRVREVHGRYEGVVEPSNKPAQSINRSGKNFFQVATNTINSFAKYWTSDARYDNHVPNPLSTIWHAAVRNPVQAKRVEHLMRSQYISPQELAEQRFIFYPLHTEPEVSLLVYGRPFVNQIELIRMIAYSMPADMMLVVKEHPWMVGKRSLASYRKILEIPRVRIVKPSYQARDLIKQAKLVAVITGSVALEAAILGVPVVTFGDCPYNTLPDFMIANCRDLRALPALFKRILSEFRCEDEQLLAYLSAVFETSESINLYSVLLKKKGVHQERSAGYAHEVSKLASYMLECIARPERQIQSAAANW